MDQLSRKETKAYNKKLSKKIRKRKSGKEKGADRVAKLIANATPAELKLKSNLELLGLKFFFQYPIFRAGRLCIVDFYFPRNNKGPLIVEVDGGYHSTLRQQNKDSVRTKWLYEHTKCELIRFANNQIFLTLPSVTKNIQRYL